MKVIALADKYRVAAPRYTSYPTVPYWDLESFGQENWLNCLSASFNEGPKELSLYIHLPFCESLCTYCGCNTRITKNHGVEKPYLEAVLKEWQLYLLALKCKPVIRELHLGGGTPTFFSAENLEILIAGILKDAVTPEDAAFSFEAHPGNTTAEHLDTLNRLGFQRLSLGIQDFDPRVQLAINRMQSVPQVSNITKLARERGYSSINYDLIYGLPHQTISGLQETIQQVLKLRPDRIAFYSYAHVPWVKPGQRRYTESDLPSPESKRELYELGRKLFKEGGYAEIGMDHFTLETDNLYQAEISGTLHRNFMGYTDQYSGTMIGLGVSSISDSWNAYAQNVKTVEEYIQMVGRGEFAVCKGHILTETDLLIRQNILNIMCRGCTSWTVEDLKIEAFADGLSRLRWLAEDGLVVLSAFELSVTPLGKRFLRNICMALDARLWENQPTTQLFSVAD